jgi:hypothetical protein
LRCSNRTVASKDAVLGQANATHQLAARNYNEDNMAHLTPERHYMFHIRAAQTIDRLNEITLDIDYDKWEEVEYTKDADAMAMLRYEWASRKNELTEGNSV